MADQFTKIIYNKLHKIINEQGIPQPPSPEQSALPGTPPTGIDPTTPQQPGGVPAADPMQALQQALQQQPNNEKPENTDDTIDKAADKVIKNLSVVSPDDFNSWISPPGRSSNISEGEEERAKILYSKLHKLFIFIDQVESVMSELDEQGVTTGEQ